MSGIRTRVELEGVPDPIEVVYDGRDVRAWEADTGESYLSTPDSYTQREHLTWFALRRQQLTDLDLDGFRAVCVAVNAVGAGDPVGPTQQAPTGEPS